MTDNRIATDAPGWFTLASIAAILWEGLGCALVVLQAMADPASLPRDQQAIWAATPDWMNIAWAFAVVTGIAGAVLLAIRNRRSEPLLLVSFLAVVVQFSGLVLVPELRNLTGSDDLLMPFVVALICYGIWHLARHARKEGWLR